MPNTNPVYGNDAANGLNGTSGADLIYGFDPNGPQATVTQIQSERIAGGFTQSVYAGAPAGDLGRLFVVEKGGLIKIVNLETGATLATPFLDVSAQISTLGEKGLLGLAFDPDFASNGYFYINMINASGDTEIRRYQVSATDSNVADPASMTPIITIDQPADNNHKAGWLGFGADGYLYIPMGDGGGTGDPNNNAQNLGTLLGKIVRIDVRSDGFPADPARHYAIPVDNPFVAGPGLDEIWALGLRNPWRASFDRATGDLFLGDVGQGAFEEIDIGVSGGNYGWRVYEGDATYNNSLPLGGGVLTAPIHAYGRDVGSIVTGGYVYRGPGEGLQGQYVFGDVATDDIFSLFNNGGVWTRTTRTAQMTGSGTLVNGPVSFGEDGYGRLYVVGYDGNINRLTPLVVSTDLGDAIQGHAGNDFIHGGSGGDTIDAGADDDTAYGGNGQDQVAGGVGDDVLFGDADNDAVLGGDGDDVVDGGDGNDNVRGDAGADRVSGGAGNDYLYVDGLDTLVSGGAGYDWAIGVDSTTGVTLDLGIAAIEGVQGSNSAGDTLDASSSTSGVNIWGLGGADFLTGGAFNDYIYFDELDIASGSINGGAGYDWLLNRGATAVSFDMAARGAEGYYGSVLADTVTAAGSVAGVSIYGNGGGDVITGSGFTDYIYFEADTVSINGGAGYDYAIYNPVSVVVGVTLNLTASNIEIAVGRSGADTFDATGATWAVRMLGDAGGDTLTAGNAGSTLEGQAGTDTLVSGSGVDYMLGGTEVDIFRFADGGGVDYIYDWQDGTDRIDLSLVAGINGFGDLTITNGGSNWYGVGYGSGTIWVQTGGVGALDATDFIY